VLNVHLCPPPSLRPILVMPATNALVRAHPDLWQNTRFSLCCPPDSNPLFRPKRESSIIVKGYGDWTSFMQSYGLKAWDDGDIGEAKRILEGLVASDKWEEKERKAATTAKGAQQK
jgi:hypothetical protein